jgi:hypothetical protein
MDKNWNENKPRVFEGGQYNSEVGPKRKEDFAPLQQTPHLHLKAFPSKTNAKINRQSLSCHAFNRQ